MGFGFGFAMQSNQIWAGTCWKLEIDLGTGHPGDTSLILGSRAGSESLESFQGKLSLPIHDSAQVCAWLSCLFVGEWHWGRISKFI